MKLFYYLIVILTFLSSPLFAQEKVQKWGTFELTLHGSQEGNPYAGIKLYAKFSDNDTTYKAPGFYDGNGTFKIRFMPDKEGKWTYTVYSNRDTLNGERGSFICTPPSPNYHGPVRVKNTYHFAYADSSRFIPFGTTIYSWCFSPDSIRKETIRTLKHSPFNKVRMLLIPPYSKKFVKNGPFKLNNLPFQGTKNHFNFSRFNPTYFKRLGKCIRELRRIGVQADVILLNPYDGGWGFENLNFATDKRFVKYCVARFSAYRNVWWSLANENSFIKSLTDKDWTKLFKVVKNEDPYNHLRSIHNAGRIYNYTHPWVTHVSLQYYNAAREFGVVPLLRDIYRKPIVLDEINYEGNINRRWGQLSGKQMTYRFWVTYIGGGYATHGETFKSNPWTSTGGKLIGKSPSRIAFLKKIVDHAPTLNPIDQYYVLNLAGKEGQYYLKYFGKKKPQKWKFKLPDNGLKKGMKFKVDIIDTWNMTIKHVNKTFTVKPLNRYDFVGKKGRSVKLPGRKYIALRIERVK